MFYVFAMDITDWRVNLGHITMTCLSSLCVYYYMFICVNRSMGKIHVLCCNYTLISMYLEAVF